MIENTCWSEWIKNSAQIYYGSNNNNKKKTKDVERG